MTDYNFTSTYDNVPDGPLFFSELPNAWSDKTLTFYSVNGRTIQNAFAIVPGGGPQGQKCVRMTYPAGVVGGQGPGRGPATQCRSYLIHLEAPAQPLTLEFDWLFEDGFDFSKGPGKIAPKICWGPPGGANGGAVAMIVWDSPAAGRPMPPMVANLQDQRTGATISVNTGRTAPIQTNRWYHWKIQMLGGPGGFARFWLDGNMILDWEQAVSETTITQNANINCDFYYGGGPGSAGLIDSFGRNANVWVYTGLTRPQRAR